ncbi:MAG: class II aldolase, partial [Ferrovum sp.]|nr:class II aldolase [Ferrovum sp.]
GNLSLRDGAGFWITPSGVPTAEMTAEDMVWMNFDGAVRGRREPSSEWLMHRDILAAYPEHHTVLHAHAPNCTALACLERELPPFHYMIAVTGGDSVRCAPYHTFGSPALAQAAVNALQNRRACLLAHHGLITAAESLHTALSIAVEVESLCEIYFKALTVGEPPRLNAEQMAEALEKFKHYGEKIVPHLLP